MQQSWTPSSPVHGVPGVTTKVGCKTFAEVYLGLMDRLRICCVLSEKEVNYYVFPGFSLREFLAAYPDLVKVELRKGGSWGIAHKSSAGSAEVRQKLAEVTAASIQARALTFPKPPGPTPDPPTPPGKTPAWASTISSVTSPPPPTSSPAAPTESPQMLEAASPPTSRKLFIGAMQYLVASFASTYGEIGSRLLPPSEEPSEQETTQRDEVKAQAEKQRYDILYDFIMREMDSTERIKEVRIKFLSFRGFLWNELLSRFPNLKMVATDERPAYLTFKEKEEQGTCWERDPSLDTFDLSEEQVAAARCYVGVDNCWAWVLGGNEGVPTFGLQTQPTVVWLLGLPQKERDSLVEFLHMTHPTLWLVPFKFMYSWGVCIAREALFNTVTDEFPYELHALPHWFPHICEIFSFLNFEKESSQLNLTFVTKRPADATCWKALLQVFSEDGARFQYYYQVDDTEVKVEYPDLQGNDPCVEVINNHQSRTYKFELNLNVDMNSKHTTSASYRSVAVLNTPEDLASDVLRISAYNEKTSPNEMLTKLSTAAADKVANEYRDFVQDDTQDDQWLIQHFAEQVKNLAFTATNASSGSVAQREGTPEKLAPSGIKTEPEEMKIDTTEGPERREREATPEGGLDLRQQLMENANIIDFQSQPLNRRLADIIYALQHYAVTVISGNTTTNHVRQTCQLLHTSEICQQSEQKCVVTVLPDAQTAAFFTQCVLLDQQTQNTNADVQYVTHWYPEQAHTHTGLLFTTPDVVIQLLGTQSFPPYIGCIVVSSVDIFHMLTEVLCHTIRHHLTLGSRIPKLAVLACPPYQHIVAAHYGTSLPDISLSEVMKQEASGTVEAKRHRPILLRVCLGAVYPLPSDHLDTWALCELFAENGIPEVSPGNIIFDTHKLAADFFQEMGIDGNAYAFDEAPSSFGCVAPTTTTTTTTSDSEPPAKRSKSNLVDITDEAYVQATGENVDQWETTPFCIVCVPSFRREEAEKIVGRWWMNNVCVKISHEYTIFRRMLKLRNVPVVEIDLPDHQVVEMALEDALEWTGMKFGKDVNLEVVCGKAECDDVLAPEFVLMKQQSHEMAKVFIEVALPQLHKLTQKPYQLGCIYESFPLYRKAKKPQTHRVITSCGLNYVTNDGLVQTDNVQLNFLGKINDTSKSATLISFRILGSEEPLSEDMTKDPFFDSTVQEWAAPAEFNQAQGYGNMPLDMSEHPFALRQLLHEIIDFLKKGTNEGGILILLPELYDVITISSALASGSIGDTLWICPILPNMPPRQFLQFNEPTPRGKRKLVLMQDDFLHLYPVRGIRFVVNASARVYDTLLHARFLAGQHAQGFLIHLFPRVVSQRIPLSSRPAGAHCVPISATCLRVYNVFQHEKLVKSLETRPCIWSGAVGHIPALTALWHKGASAPNYAPEKGVVPINFKLTTLGVGMSHIPVPVHISKMLVIASVLGVFKPVLTVAAAFLVSRTANIGLALFDVQDPLEKQRVQQSRMSVYHSVSKLDGGDVPVETPLLVCTIFDRWCMIDDTEEKARFCRALAVSDDVFNALTWTRAAIEYSFLNELRRGNMVPPEDMFPDREQFEIIQPDAIQRDVPAATKPTAKPEKEQPSIKTEDTEAGTEEERVALQEEEMEADNNKEVEEVDEELAAMQAIADMQPVSVEQRKREYTPEAAEGQLPGTGGTLQDQIPAMDYSYTPPDFVDDEGLAPLHRLYNYISRNANNLALVNCILVSSKSPEAVLVRPPYVASANPWPLLLFASCCTTNPEKNYVMLDDWLRLQTEDTDLRRIMGTLHSAFYRLVQEFSYTRSLNTLLRPYNKAILKMVVKLLQADKHWVWEQPPPNDPPPLPVPPSQLRIRETTPDRPKPVQSPPSPTTAASIPDATSDESQPLVFGMSYLGGAGGGGAGGGNGAAPAAPPPGARALEKYASGLSSGPPTIEPKRRSLPTMWDNDFSQRQYDRYVPSGEGAGAGRGPPPAYGGDRTSSVGGLPRTAGIRDLLHRVKSTSHPYATASTSSAQVTTPPPYIPSPTATAVAQNGAGGVAGGSVAHQQNPNQSLDQLINLLSKFATPQGGNKPQAGAAIPGMAQQRSGQQLNSILNILKKPEGGILEGLSGGPASAQQEASLPPNWEMKKDPRTGRSFYINHVTKSTQWKHPRLQ